MPEYLRALAFLLLLGTLFFWLARQSALSIIEADRYIRWRNLWLGLTTLAFISHSYWIYAFIVAITLILQSKKENNPIAQFFMLLFLIPPITAAIPGFGLINYLLLLNHPRLLALCILLPAALSISGRTSTLRFGSIWADRFLIGYLFLIITLELRDRTFTDMLRVAFYTWTDVFLPYYVASRSLKNLRQFREAMTGFMLSTMLLAAIGFFEFFRHWLLYSSLSAAMDLNLDPISSYLGRSDMLRALATTGQAIVLGYVIATAIGIYIFLQYFIQNRLHRRLGWLLLVAGIISPLSRGPWIGAVVILIVFLGTGKNAFASISKMLVAACLAFALVTVMPGGEKAINLLPFIGTTEKSNIDYRDKLINNALVVINRNLYFGSINYRDTPEMREMREGAFGVDIVNSYIGIALDYGVIGLGLFALFFFSVLTSIFRTIRSSKEQDDEITRLGRSLFATLIGILVIIVTVSSISFIPIIYWSLAGLGIAYAQMVKNGRGASDKVDSDGYKI